MNRLLVALIALSLFAFTACTKEESTTPDPAAPAEKAEGTGGGGGMAAAPSAAVNAQLAMADAKDGKTDKIVAKCAGCALHMDGDAAHAMTLGEYELHLCSASCKEKFGTDTEKKILALK